MAEYGTQLSDIESVGSRIDSAMSFDKLSLSHSLSSSGFLTENSSLFSMSENDFDQLATKKTCELFDMMDGVLFDGLHGGSVGVIKECHEWKSAFPHLRLTGVKLLDSQEEGFQRYSPTYQHNNLINGGASSENILNKQINELSGDFNRMKLEVKGEKASKILKSSHDDDGGYACDGDDEIIEFHGDCEEIIAIDHHSEDKKRHAHTHNKGLPPMTPINCLRDQVISSMCHGVLQGVGPIVAQLLLRFKQQQSNVSTKEKIIKKLPNKYIDSNNVHHQQQHHQQQHQQQHHQHQHHQHDNNQTSHKTHNPRHKHNDNDNDKNKDDDDDDDDEINDYDDDQLRKTTNRHNTHHHDNHHKGFLDKSNSLSTLFPQQIDDINLNGVLTVAPLFVDSIKESEISNMVHMKSNHHNNFKQQRTCSDLFDHNNIDIANNYHNNYQQHHVTTPSSAQQQHHKTQSSLWNESNSKVVPQTDHHHNHHHHIISHLLSVPEEPRSSTNQPSPTPKTPLKLSPLSSQQRNKNPLPRLRNKPHTAVSSNIHHHNQQQSFNKLSGQLPRRRGSNRASSALQTSFQQQRPFNQYGNYSNATYHSNVFQNSKFKDRLMTGKVNNNRPSSTHTLYNRKPMFQWYNTSTSLPNRTNVHTNRTSNFILPDIIEHKIASNINSKDMDHHPHHPQLGNDASDTRSRRPSFNAPSSLMPHIHDVYDVPLKSPMNVLRSRLASSPYLSNDYPTMKMRQKQPFSFQNLLA